MQNLGHNANLLPFSYDEEKAAVRKAFILREDHRVTDSRLGDA